jgi:hypothetical protein
VVVLQFGTSHGFSTEHIAAAVCDKWHGRLFGPEIHADKAAAARATLVIGCITTSDLHPSAIAVLWIVDTYLVVFGCLLIPAQVPWMTTMGASGRPCTTFQTGAQESACGGSMMSRGLQLEDHPHSDLDHT